MNLGLPENTYGYFDRQFNDIVNVDEIVCPVDVSRANKAK
jgi:hypothetical protein